jgi:hypothetical protein
MSISALKASFIVGLVIFMGIATASQAQTTKPAPPTPIEEKKVELGGTAWDPQWDQIIGEGAASGNAFFTGSPGNVERSTPVEADFADPRLPIGYRAAMSAGVAAHPIAVQLFV